MKLAFFFVVKRNCKDNEEDVYKAANKYKEENNNNRDEDDMINDERGNIREDGFLMFREKLAKMNFFVLVIGLIRMNLLILC